MDIVGTADPYFVANIDEHISFLFFFKNLQSSNSMGKNGWIYLDPKIIRNSLDPVWNESWRVKNVPATATFHVAVMDKDKAAVTDDRVGEFDTLPWMRARKRLKSLGLCFTRTEIHAFDKDDQSLKDSVQACREYSIKYRGAGKDELQPAGMKANVSSTNEARKGAEQKYEWYFCVRVAGRGNEAQKTGLNGSAALTAAKVNPHWDGLP